MINNHNDFIGKIEITKENLIRYMVFHLTSPDNPKTIEQNLNDEAQELEDYLNLIEKDLNLIKENLNFKTLTISNRQIKIKLIQDFIKKSSQINKEIKNLTDKIIYSINSELIRIDSELKYIKKGLDEMNKIIKRIVGDKFKLTESDDGYSVDRQKKCLSTLSEGEKTILAIAHFFSNLKSKEYQHTHTSGKLIDKNLTLIIDDPISSLDETNIYMICGYIWEFLKNNNRKIKQFIFLTHRFSVGKNFTMILDIYRKISKKNNKIGDSENQADLFIIKNGSIKKSDKFKDFFYDEYRHLFKQVIDWKNNLSTVDRNNKYIIGNVCRKVLEAFSYFKIGNNYDKLCIEYEGQIDSAISKTTGNSLNIHSHLRYNIFEDLDEDTAKQFPEYVCEIIKAIDENHYKSFESKIDREAI